jgi:hypothetical protein
VPILAHPDTVYLGLDVHRDSISVAALHPGHEQADVERIFHDGVTTMGALSLQAEAPAIARTITLPPDLWGAPSCSVLAVRSAVPGVNVAGHGTGSVQFRRRRRNRRGPTSRKQHLMANQSAEA